MGKTLYAITLRKKLLSDDYYSITPITKSQSPQTLKFTVKEEEPVVRIGMAISEPADGTFTKDVSNLLLNVKKDFQRLQDKLSIGMVQLWTGQMPLNPILNSITLLTGGAVQKLMNKTNANGISKINITISEYGIVKNGNNTTDYNDHVFFVIEGGKVKPIIIDVNVLALNKTLRI
ncbi:hypothetical protein [Pseudopedobacter sp.]|uniref:hypothetical protein n=1 Tax=Pseudopedobacter sp. TaxID=1936787 RepID=UPI00334202FC